MDDYETIEYHDYKIRIVQDSDPENPLEWTTPDDRAGHVEFALKHRRYDLPWEVLTDTDDFDSWQEFAEHTADGRKFKFVDWYEHSGIAVSLTDEPVTGDRWDSGIVGVIFGDTDDAIDGYFNDWKAYVEGDVWGYEITDEFGEDMDSCWGFYGYDYCVEQAKAEVDAYLKAPFKHEFRKAPDARRLHK